jgi:hypothetical protein
VEPDGPTASLVSFGLLMPTRAQLMADLPKVTANPWAGQGDSYHDQLVVRFLAARAAGLHPMIRYDPIATIDFDSG